jgi:F0F1-type ATP synthase assembly protein I
MSSGVPSNGAAMRLRNSWRTAQRVKHHPAETIAATLAFGLLAGLVAGTFIGWMLKRR